MIDETFENIKSLDLSLVENIPDTENFSSRKKDGKIVKIGSMKKSYRRKFLSVGANKSTLPSKTAPDTNNKTGENYLATSSGIESLLNSETLFSWIFPPSSITFFFGNNLATSLLLVFATVS